MRQTSKQVTLKHLQKELEYRRERDYKEAALCIEKLEKYEKGTAEHNFNRAMRNYHEGKIHAYQHALNLIEDELGYI